MAQSTASDSAGQLSRIVDTDVHHSFGERSDLTPYMPEAYEDRWEMYGIPSLGRGFANNGGDRAVREDVQDSDDPLPFAGAPPELVQTKLLDGCGIDIAILTGLPTYRLSSTADVEYANAIATAFNEYTVEEYLDVDDRFRYQIAINHRDPEASAEEIRRIGDHPQVTGVMMPIGASRTFGNKFYDPIYEASEELNLTISLHLGNDSKGVHGHPPTAAGWPNHYAENRVMRQGTYQSHLASFILQGTFEKYPDLRVSLLECGWAWVPAYLWRMDANWKALRDEVPWVERPPSEYFKDHVKVNTQPVEEPPTADDLRQIVDWMDGDRTLMFATDFPHWDFDDPARTLLELDGETRERVFAENAKEQYDLDI
ncbi:MULTISPECIES: amidohydrolase family protein [Salinibaculum]|uniref:amidohydrolase family protein n=1 Tax=Salinibaculum TaxID=2732368 RepID=UPI0030CBF6EE